MIPRRAWLQAIESAWREKTVVWLAGVRRAGKTVLSRELPRVRYFDCEIPGTRRLLLDPERFLGDNRGRRVVLDEIHRLDNPSELLKIAADHYRDVRILATGSSTLGATRKFRDTLAGRKATVWLTPMDSRDLAAFGSADLSRRIVRGGLPPLFLGRAGHESAFQDWMDDYWAKDIEELFRLERRGSFLKFTELLMTRSGGMFEATDFARACEIARPTVLNYLSILETTFVAHVVRPFSSRRPAEIVSAPRVYGFDTGFVCYYRGLDAPGPQESGLLWEHIVLNELQAGLQTRRINYWRDKKGREVDFVLQLRGAPPVAIECKWKAANAEVRGLLEFARRFPGARLILAASDVRALGTRDEAGQRITVTGLPGLVPHLLATTKGLTRSPYGQ